MNDDTPQEEPIKDNIVKLKSKKKLDLFDILNEDTSDETDSYTGIDTKKLKELNNKHAFIVSYNGKPSVLAHIYDEVFERKIIQFVSPDAIEKIYCNQSMPTPNGTGSMELGKWWVKHAARREYEGVIFDPKLCERDEYGASVANNCLNLWEGFACDPRKGTWKKTRTHIWKILCKKDKQKFKYVIRWIAWAVQNPGTRAEVAIIFKGKKGAGKGFLFTQLVKIFGRHGMPISNRKHLTGQFNGHLQHICFLFADEAYYPGDKEVEGTLKQLITEQYMPVEGKHLTTKMGVNHLHICMSTNNDWVIPADVNERRFYIDVVDNKYAKGECSDGARNKYFKSLWNEMDNGGREAMLFDLQNLFLDDWHPRSDVPETEELENQKVLNLRKEEKCILAFIEEGIFPGRKMPDNSFQIEVPTLNDHLETIDPGSLKISMQRKSGVLKNLGCVTAREDNTRVWVFPDLKTLRERWIRMYGSFKFDANDNWSIKKTQF